MRSSGNGSPRQSARGRERSAPANHSRDAEKLRVLSFVKKTSLIDENDTSEIDDLIANARSYYNDINTNLFPTETGEFPIQE